MTLEAGATIKFFHLIFKKTHQNNFSILGILKLRVYKRRSRSQKWFKRIRDKKPRLQTPKIGLSLPKGKENYLREKRLDLTIWARFSIRTSTRVTGSEILPIKDQQWLKLKNSLWRMASWKTAKKTSSEKPLRMRCWKVSNNSWNMSNRKINRQRSGLPPIKKISDC